MMITLNIKKMELMPVVESNAPIPHSLSRTITKSGNYGLADAAREMFKINNTNATRGRGRGLRFSRPSLGNEPSRDLADVEATIRALDVETNTTVVCGNWRESTASRCSGRSSPVSVVSLEDVEPELRDPRGAGKRSKAPAAPFQETLARHEYEDENLERLPYCQTEFEPEVDTTKEDVYYDYDPRAELVEQVDRAISELGVSDAEGSLVPVSEGSFAESSVRGSGSEKGYAGAIVTEDSVDNIGSRTYRRVVVETADGSEFVRYIPLDKEEECYVKAEPPANVVYARNVDDEEMMPAGPKNSKGGSPKGKQNGYVMFLQHIKRTTGTTTATTVSDLIRLFDKDWKALPESERQMWKERAKTGRSGGAGGGGGEARRGGAQGYGFMRGSKLLQGSTGGSSISGGGQRPVKNPPVVQEEEESDDEGW